MALDALIFDLDGTLIDTTSVHARAWCQAFEEYGFSIPEDRIRLEIGKGGDRLMTTLIGEQATREHGEALRDTHLSIYLETIKQEGVRPFPRVMELFDALAERGLKTSIATASKQDSLHTALEQAGLLDLLDRADVVISDNDVAHSKPHPDAVRPAVEQLGLSPAQCAFVGDTTYDVEASKRAGLVCLGVTSGPHDEARLHRAGTRAVYGDVADLLDRLDEALAKASPGKHRLTQDVMSSLMEEALAEAQTGMDQGQVPIGSVLARSDGTIVARAHNEARRRGDRLAHAEMEALRHAGSALAEGARDLVLVTTLEPCVMCLGAAMHARIDTIVYALPAPLNGGLDRCRPLDSPGAVYPRFVGNVRAEASRALLEAWLETHPDHAFVKETLRPLGETASTPDIVT